MKKKNILLNITSFQADKELKLKFVMANKGHILTKEVEKILEIKAKQIHL